MACGVMNSKEPMDATKNKHSHSLPTPKSRRAWSKLEITPNLAGARGRPGPIGLRQAFKGAEDRHRQKGASNAHGR
ncbi:hypothetical protein N7510_004239 [Penicillium lagena]|uniref:uncharacterized protein n=1 Tax=Penicillium lagena TaxID=94218 RepID=UPI0025408149|nr:uncharacterized protein N7510_004239 [Penicillium lagena]KAJ5620255.1 hypothetical protein N7510_004239 [Penicillium lagena]